MRSQKSRTTIAAGLTILFLSACGDRLGPERPGSLGIPVTDSGPPREAPSGTRRIVPGQTLVGEIRSTDLECEFRTVGGGWGGLCDAFEVSVPTHGTLLSTVRWSADAPLALFLKTPAGEQIDMICCGSPIVFQSSADSGVTYRLEVAYSGRPASYPQIPSVYYTIETALLSVEAQTDRGLSAIVFGDPARTQWLSGATLEVVRGPLSGNTAVFHGGRYTLVGLPPGFVEIRLSADGFDTETMRLPVGTATYREIVLRRSQPLPTGHSVGGATLYDGVQVEILDGPLAGVFTFADEFGWYQFRSVAPGVTRLRASRFGLQTQELTVSISGDTRLDFVMQKQ